MAAHGLARNLRYNSLMRRKEREITDRSEIDALLLRTKVCRIAFAVDGEAYIVPLSHGYDPDANALFFHTAKEGKKIECIEANPRVCFEVEGRADVKEGNERGCSWGVRFESVIGYGTLVEVVDPVEKVAALRVTMRQQAGRDGAWTFAEKMVDATRVWRLDIESVTGKRSFVRKTA
jgi:nitroimidazol reductase NimA-like FMN-containing flavoprotein (pyridoxamine 5'-phosphate oxidase superfamily)